jgi:trehalose 2-sulfotransferase
MQRRPGTEIRHDQARFLRAGKIMLLTIASEDFVAEYEQTVFDVLKWLGLDAETVIVLPSAHERPSDAVSEDRVQRFRRDKQSDWKNRAR